jgi:hypothetical protein
MSLVWVMGIFTTARLSTVLDQDPHDFRVRGTVIPARPAREVQRRFGEPVPMAGSYRRDVSRAPPGFFV